MGIRRFRLDVDLSQDDAAVVVECGQQMPSGPPGCGRSPQRLAVDRDQAPAACSGAVRCWAHAPAASSSASASRLCSTRRNVDSHGTTPVTPSPSKVAWPASAAHSAIATTTAPLPAPRTPPGPGPPPPDAAPRGALSDQGTRPATAERLPSRPRARAAASNWPTAGPIGDDGAAGMAPRKRSGRCRNRHDHFPGRARAATAPSPACRELPPLQPVKTLPTPCLHRWSDAPWPEPKMACFAGTPASLCIVIGAQGPVMSRAADSRSRTT